MPKPKPSVRRTSSTAKGSVRKTHKPKDLSEYQEKWAATPVPDVASRGRLPEGTYQASIEEALIDGDQVKFVFTITDGDFANRKAFKNMQLDDEEGIGMSILKGDLAVLGAEMPEDIEGLPEVLAGLANTPVEIFNRVKFSEKHGREFANVFINGRLDSDEAETAPAKRPSTAKGKPVEEEEAIEVGATVEFKDGKKTLQGEVKAIEDEQVTVNVDGEEWEMELNEVVLVEAPTPAPAKKSPTKKTPAKANDDEDMVGKTVEFESDGQMMSGSVTGIDAKGNLEVEVDGEVWAVDPAECQEVEAKKGPVKRVVAKKKF